jgi:DNA invertase Pin-like site-specific DNA recombinase
MNAVLYCRVSSKEQEAEGFSLDAQKRTGRECARKHSLNVIRF